MTEPTLPKKPQKMLKWWMVALVLLLLAGIAAGAYLYFSHPHRTVERLKPKLEREEELLLPPDKITMMLMGVDERHDDVGRSDTLMLATFDPEKERIALLSIPRDTRVKIKGHGFDKINAAYAYGDEKLAQETVENFMGVHIDHYAIVNVAAFVKVIDALGGVDVNVEKRMYYEDPWDDDGGLVIDFQPGLQHMDGQKAMTYVRYRDEIGDAGRIERQQEFIRACVAKLVSPSTILRLPDIIQEIYRATKTDMTLQDCLELANAMKNVSPGSLKTDVVPGEYSYIDGICYMLPDIKKLRKTISDTLEVEVDARTRERFEQDEQEYEDSVPEHVVPVGNSTESYSSSYREPSPRSSEPKSSEQGSSRDADAKDKPTEPSSSDRTEQGKDGGAKADEKDSGASDETGNSREAQDKERTDASDASEPATDSSSEQAGPSGTGTEPSGTETAPEEAAAPPQSNDSRGKSR